MNKPIKIIAAAAIIALFGAFANAQISSGGAYTVNQTVVASGGGTSSDADAGNNYKIEGTTGQVAAGTLLTAGVYSIRGGFWSPNPFAPTAAGISISGRVVGTGGEGLRNVNVVLTGGLLLAPRRTRTNSFGNFAFEEVEAGHVYTVSVENKKYGFAQESQVISVLDNIGDLLFQASWEN
jgi:hypothetical protein